MTDRTAVPAPALADQWRDALSRLGHASVALAKSPPPLMKSRAYDPASLMKEVWSAAGAWAMNPAELVQRQTQAWGEWMDFWTATLKGEPAGPEIPRSDRRFADKSWSEDAAFRSLRDAYLLAGNQMRALVDATPGAEGSGKAMLGFLLDQYLNAVAPTNFAMTNPEAMRRTAETGGANLVAGFANLLEDAASGRGVVQRRTTPHFVKGENIAATPGSVVFQNHLFQLIQYDPTTPDVHAEPMLYVPPLVNRYYMIDLQPKSSLVRWLVEQGRTVFVISWVNPDARHRDCDVAAYVRDGIIAALGAVEQVTGRTGTDLFGFCLGGTLIAMALAWLAAKGQAERANSATLIGSMVDFADMRDWSAFVHEAHLDALEAHLEKRGFIDSHELQQLFSAVRSNDLIWSSVVNHYLLDKSAPPSDLLYWFEDGARIPEGFLNSYNRRLLFGNTLREAGGFAVDDVAIDLAAVKTPLMIVALKDDHVSAWQAVYAGAKLFGGEVEYVLGGSGHNAGVINPPAANKHGYWRNSDLPDTADAWLSGAQQLPGSWWPMWDAWLSRHGSRERVEARRVGEGALRAIEPAPGSYLLAAD